MSRKKGKGGRRKEEGKRRGEGKRGRRGRRDIQRGENKRNRKSERKNRGNKTNLSSISNDKGGKHLNRLEVPKEGNPTHHARRNAATPQRRAVGKE